MEARRLGHQYLGPEHLLVGLLAQGDNLAARVLAANGLDLDTVRAGIDRLVAQGVLPGPQPADDELLASPEHLLLGLLLEAEEPVGTDLPVETRRERALLGLAVNGPQPLRLLVEAEGRTLEGLREALLEAIDGR
jgi:ATP-dependent Clp protease ATP-binding subunit ClpC